MPAALRSKTLVLRLTQRRTFVTRCSELYAEKTRFSNREKEMDFVLNILKHCTSQLSLITGPINSGKTMLMRQVIEVLSEDPKREPAILPFNMRELPFVDVNTFVFNFKRMLCKWYGKALQKFQTKSKHFNVEWIFVPPTLVDLLKLISKKLSDRNWLRGYNIPTPILFIDEVNFVEDPFYVVYIDDQGAGKFHVVLSSSDSFMYSWLGSYLVQHLHYWPFVKRRG